MTPSDNKSSKNTRDGVQDISKRLTDIDVEDRDSDNVSETLRDAESSEDHHAPHPSANNIDEGIFPMFRLNAQQMLQLERSNMPLSQQSIPSASHKAQPHTSPNNAVRTESQTQSAFDPSGQTAPPGITPSLGVALWEEDRTLVFGVNVNGVCVTRREDNNFINVVAMLKAVGMTHDQYEHVLRNESIRHVVNVHACDYLKGVWVPFARALELANQESIIDMLFPLFVHNIAALCYTPKQQTPPDDIIAEPEVDAPTSESRLPAARKHRL